MTLRYSRYTPGHGGPAQSRSLTVEDDGTATATQSFGRRAGRFARPLTEDEQRTYRAALAAAGAAEPPSAPGGPTAPATTTEQITADGVPSVQFAPSDEPPAGFGDLVAFVRHLLDGLTDSPVAGLELSLDGSRVTLRHAGTEPITVRAGSLTLRVIAYDENDLISDQRSVEVTADVDEPVGPGWELPLAGDVDLPAGYVTITAAPLRADVEGDGVLRDVELSWETG